MLIMAQTEILVNSEHIKDIYFEEGQIIADCIDNREIILGDYKNEYRAEEVLQKIAQSYGAINTFYMPEE